mmetsp:Transcript_54207/g.106052  ORF Transcript_54207/g.106052 Transcript_54207/m.106052 type:complete len:86 (-) Transcript_54207:656-913(-)
MWRKWRRREGPVCRGGTSPTLQQTPCNTDTQTERCRTQEEDRKKKGGSKHLKTEKAREAKHKERETKSPDCDAREGNRKRQAKKE